MAGRELSVIDAFHFDLIQACQRHGAIDLKISLNSGDRNLNADSMFAINGRFFLVEFKSNMGSLQDEDRKESACFLCEGLLEVAEALELHQECHFAMWGRKKKNDGLDTFYGVYEDLVCRPETLPSCEAVRCNQKLNIPQIGAGEELADKVARKSAGLDRAGFLAYLEWLLGAKDTASTYEESSELPITLFGTSFAGGVKSREFKNFKQLADWAEPFISSYKSAQIAATPDPTPPPPSSPKNGRSGGFSGPKF
ncbi:hypothetical protein [Pseudomonas sp.]|uniref:hypothetical protein n=1 Tax=Pseudomonas sp. TaxID=306 RepID=UPI003A97AA67